MILTINKESFDQIKSGHKLFEWTAAHIIFICEDSGETIIKPVKYADIVNKGSYTNWAFLGLTEQEFNNSFPDSKIIGFRL